MDTQIDFLIVGSGIAGLRAAAELAARGRVLVLTKSHQDEGSTGYAQGGIAAAVGDDDAPEQHAADTLRAGDGLCDPRAVEVLTGEGPRYVRELIAWGAGFERDDRGRLDLGREGAHGVRRVLHARDQTGREIARVLGSRLAELRTVRVLAHAAATELMLEGDRCAGVRYLDDTGGLSTLTAKATLLATGGAGRIFRETTNPAVATGDGITIAFRAGARVSDLEFVQFHPTALSLEGAPRFLLSEALRGEGARLVNEAGDAFMWRDEPLGELAPRDRVARAIVREAERTGGRIYLTLAHLPPAFVHARFPLISDTCRSLGLDLARDRIPIGPAAHYVMGGIETDLHGRTSVRGLFAAGEVACTHVHGANRLASNSLLEGLVFGARAAEAMRAWAADPGTDWPRWPPVAAERQETSGSLGRSALPGDPGAIEDVMWRHVGLFRDGRTLAPALESLRTALREIEEQLARSPSDPELLRVASLRTVAWLMARAALRRTESRGAHWRSDFPDRNDVDWMRHCADTRDSLDA